MEKGDSAIELEKKFSRGKTYLLSENGFFLFRFVDGAFGSKWCGFWDRDLKFLEYFAFRVDGEWLCPENFKRFIYTGAEALHIHSLFVGEVTERVVVGDGTLIVNLKLPRRCEVLVEVGVNIRRREEGIHGRVYNIISRSESVEVMNELGKIEIGVRGGEFLPNPRREIHFPGRYAMEHGYDFRWYEDEQEKFIPGIFRFEGRELKFWAGKKAGAGHILRKKRRKLKEKEKKTENWKLASTLLSFYFEREYAGFLAGFPYFNQFWTRDFLCMFTPLIRAGFEREAHKALLTIARHQLSDGSIPVIVGSEKPCADSTPLFLLACYKAFKSGRKAPMKNVKMALQYGVEHFDGELVEHDPRTTWMDTLRRGYAVEVESFWAKAFEVWGKLFKNKKLLFLSEKIKESLISSYLQSGVFLDSLKGKYKFSVNSLIPLTYSVVRTDEENIFKRAKEELFCNFGVRAISRREVGDDYHARIWGISTYWGLKFLSRHNPEEARKIFVNYLKFMGSRTVCGFPETMKESGEVEGASSQLWSVAFIPEMLQELWGRGRS